jgi:polyferredoxin
MMKKSKAQTRRMIVQIVSLALALGFLALVIRGTNHSIHEACPYAFVCFGLSGSTFLRLGGWAMAGMVVFGFAMLVYTIFQGRKFCAWLCPLGTVQELLFSLRGKSYRMKHRSPFYVERKLAFLKYLILLITVVLTLLGFNYLFIRLCPFYSLSLLPKLFAPGILVLGIVLLISCFSDRVWCRFLCPYAALMNIFQWLGDTVGIQRKKIRRNLERCTDCGLCSLNCPMNINIAENEFVQDRNCIHCGLCAESCPKPGTYTEERECENQPRS